VTALENVHVKAAGKTTIEGIVPASRILIVAVVSFLMRRVSIQDRRARVLLELPVDLQMALRVMI
jgi:hypothetical protein